MRKLILATLAALAFLSCTADAGRMSLLGAGGVGSAAPKVLAYRAHCNDSAGNCDSCTGTGCTYTAAIGTAAADRCVFVIGSQDASVGRTLSLTVNGGAVAALVDSFGSGGGNLSIYGVNVPSGTTAVIVLTVSGASGGIGIGVLTSTGTANCTTTAGTPQTSTTNNTALNLTTLAGGFVIAGASVGGASWSAAWTNATGDYPSGSNGQRGTGSGAHAATVGTSLAVTPNLSNTNRFTAAAVAF